MEVDDRINKITKSQGEQSSNNPSEEGNEIWFVVITIVILSLLSLAEKGIPFLVAISACYSLVVLIAFILGELLGENSARKLDKWK